MTIFLWNILLALAWLALTGVFTPGNLLVGFVLSYVILRFAQRALGPSPYFGKVFDVIRLVLFFLYELIASSLRVAHDVLTPTHYMRPGVIAILLEMESDEEITLVANLISLTPGTLSLDVSADKRTLYIHAMYIDDEDLDVFRQKIKRFERKVLEVTR
jgi:multicomponent Na+:H+ antiporter subunit E